MPIKIFFCYAHEDEAMLKKLKTQLRPLQRQGLINEFWYDREISAGASWEQELVTHLNTSQIILLLVSADFIDSDYCYSKEMQRAIERHERREACVIPIILRHVHWQETPLGKLQALPTDANPILSNSWHSLDEAFFNVVDGVRKAIMDLSQNLLSNSQLSDSFFQGMAKGRPIPEVLNDCYPGLDDLFKEVIKAMRVRISQGIARRRPIPEVLNDCYPGLDDLFKEVIKASNNNAIAALQARIEKLLREVSAAGDGDLSVSAEVTPDTLGVLADSFNYMIEELAKVVGRVQSTSVQVTNATRRILDRSADLAQATETQVSEISQTSEAVEALAVFIQNVARNAQSSVEAAQEALRCAANGQQAVRQTIEGMLVIRENVQETSKKIKRLGERSNEIGEIVRIIEDIADQTNLLALNAAIQSAMAGEHGRGFAVVADEIRVLAERSTESTKRIATLVKSIQGDTYEAVVAMEDSTQEVVKGSQLADDAGRSLNSIYGAVERQAQMIESIARAANEQTSVSEAVAVAMNQISEITRQTDADTQEAAVSVSYLAELSEQLRASVSTFRLPDRLAEKS